MERSREQPRRWNTGQVLRSLDEAHLSRSRSVAHSASSSSGRGIASRLGMTEVSCFPKRSSTSSRTEYPSRPSSDSHRRAGHASRIAPDRGKAIHVINNELAEIDDRQAASFTDEEEDEDDEAFALSLLERPKAAEVGTTSVNDLRRSVNGKRKISSSFARGSSSSSSGPGKGKTEMEGQVLRNQRGRNLQRPSSFVEEQQQPQQQQQQQRPKVSRRSDAASSSSAAAAAALRFSRDRDSVSSDLDRLLNSSPFTRRSGTADTRGRSRNYDPRPPAETAPRGVRNAAFHPEPSRYSRRSTPDSSTRDATPGSSSGSQQFGKRNISSCFGSGRRSPSPRPLGGRYERGVRHHHHLASSSSSPPGARAEAAPPVSLLSAALEAAAAASSSASNTLRQHAGQAPPGGGDGAPGPQERVWSPASGWEYHRPRLMAEGLAKILLALERVENDEELTHEQLLMLEATVLFGGMGLHDRHSDWRMDVDHMSYEELLALEEKIGDVNTGLNEASITRGLQKCRFSTLFSRPPGGQEEELKCSICQEEYKNGDRLGRVDCGHKFHVACIKQWLLHKNLCPICKSTALSS